MKLCHTGIPGCCLYFCLTERKPRHGVVEELIQITKTWLKSAESQLWCIQVLVRGRECEAIPSVLRIKQGSWGVSLLALGCSQNYSWAVRPLHSFSYSKLTRPPLLCSSTPEIKILTYGWHTPEGGILRCRADLSHTSGACCVGPI